MSGRKQTKPDEARSFSSLHTQRNSA